MNIAIIGHVDNGKSSLLSRILYPEEGGDTSKLDILDEEKERGITQEYSTRQYENLVFVDTAGHKSFIRSNIEAYTSIRIDLALIICSLRKGEFKAGFVTKTNETIAPLKEQLLLVRSSGVKHALIVLTKVDLDPSILESEKTIDSLQTFLKRIQMKCHQIIKVSSKTGEGIDNLLSSIRSFAPTPAPAPIVPQITDTFAGSFTILFIPVNKIITAGSLFVAHSGGKEAECTLDKIKPPSAPILKQGSSTVVKFVLKTCIPITNLVIIRMPEATIGFCKVTRANLTRS